MNECCARCCYLFCNQESSDDAETEEIPLPPGIIKQSSEANAQENVPVETPSASRYDCMNRGI